MNRHGNYKDKSCDMSKINAFYTYLHPNRRRGHPDKVCDQISTPFSTPA